MEISVCVCGDGDGVVGGGVTSVDFCFQSSLTCARVKFFDASMCVFRRVCVRHTGIARWLHRPHC